MIDSTLPISLLRQHVFCPRIPFFHEVMGLRPEKPFWVEAGRDQHQEQQRLFRHRSLRRFGLETAFQHFNTALVSTSLGLHGIADLILATEEEVIPVEIKATHRPGFRGAIIQMFGYGLVAAEQFGKLFRKGFIVSGRKGKAGVFFFTQEWEKITRGTIVACQSNVRSAHLPSTAAQPRKCCQCEYLNFCNDRI